MREVEVHQAFSHWLDSQGLPFVHSRTDRKHTNAVGDPDYFILNSGKVLAIEFKVGRNKLSRIQEKRIAYLRKAGIAVHILQCCEKAIECTRLWLGCVDAPSQEKPRTDAWDALVWPLCGTCKAYHPEGQHSPNLWISNWCGKDYVFRTVDGGPIYGKTNQKVRPATQYDLLNIPRI